MSEYVDKAHALLALDKNEGNLKLTARQLSMSPSTLRRWRDRQDEDPDENVSHILSEVIEDELAEAKLIRQMAGARLRDKIGEASARDAAQIYKDASLLQSNLEGRKPPEQVHRHIIDVAEATAQLTAKFAEIEQEARARASLISKYSPENAQREIATVDGVAIEINE